MVALKAKIISFTLPSLTFCSREPDLNLGVLHHQWGDDPSQNVIETLNCPVFSMAIIPDVLHHTK